VPSAPDGGKTLCRFVEDLEGEREGVGETEGKTVTGRKPLRLSMKSTCLKEPMTLRRTLPDILMLEDDKKIGRFIY
jgi:hypothetical protein